MKTFITPDAREFRLDGTKPYTRRDGSATSLDVWSTQCARSGCAARFTVTVPSGCDPSTTKAFGSKHCADHKLSRSECMVLAAAARKIKRV